MVFVTIGFYAIIFIIALYWISKLMLIVDYDANKTEDEKNTFLILCVLFVLWSLSIVAIGISPFNVADNIFILASEFLKIGVFIYGAELCADLTNGVINKKRSNRSILSELFYLGVIVLIVRVAVNRMEVDQGYFGKSMHMGLDFSIILYAVFFIITIFFYGAYTYMYYYENTSKREHYISRQCVIIVGLLSVGLLVEVVGYVRYGLFLPTMYIGMATSVFVFRSLVFYKRSIEYNEADYFGILAPAHEKPSFVCDDEGKILFENTRAFVMRQTYKDSYVGKYLTDIFEITNYDKDRLTDSRNTQKFSVYCKYPKEPKEMLLTVKHNLDKFGDIFSTEVEVEYANASESEAFQVVAASNTDSEAKKRFLDLDLSIETISDIRTRELINQLKLQKVLFETEKKDLFEKNILGIEKSAAVLGLSALEELCHRIKTELTYGEWEGLNPMMIDLDRQYETLMFLNY